MKIKVTYTPILQFTTKFCKQKALKVIKKEGILLVIDADLSFSYVEHFTECRGKRYCKYNECAGWSA